MDEMYERLDLLNLIEPLEKIEIKQLPLEIVKIVKYIIQNEKNQVLFKAPKVRSIEERAYADGASDFADKLIVNFEKSITAKPEKQTDK